MRWKIMASYLVLILLMAGGLYWCLSVSLEKEFMREAREALLSEARVAAYAAARDLAVLRSDAPGVTLALAREARSRVTLIAANGEVAGDSEVPTVSLQTIENHLQRPEVQQALGEGHGFAVRYSSTLRTSMLYVALPLTTAGGEKAFLRLALPLSSIETTKQTFRLAVGAAILLATCFALVVSYFLSNLTSRSLRQMVSMASALAKGDFDRKIPVRRGDELGELAGVMNDMAARIRAQIASISSEKNRLDTILKGMGEGLLVTDSDGGIALVNPAFCSMFEVEEKIEGKPLIEISRHPALQASFRCVIETEAERSEEISSGTAQRVFLTHWVPLLEEGTVRGVVAVFHDISDLKRLEKVRSDFIANASHELRTPVTVIMGYAETLLGDSVRDPETSRRFVGIIHAHSQRLCNLIRDLLSLSELESGKMPLHLEALPVEEPLRQACSLLQEKAAQKGLALDASAARGSHVVYGDRGKLEQLFVNLLENAVKYTPASGSVSVSISGDRERVEVSIADTGVGIEPKDLPRIFERFYRVDSARNRELGGTGLGLAIVKHIVQLHGGTVNVQSVPGEGSTFQVSLPAAG